jgi:colicin import membrane protein
MEVLRSDSTTGDLVEQRWSSVLILSLLLHTAVFSLILFLPAPSPNRSFKGIVYEVDLVELPAPKMKEESKGSKATTKKMSVSSKRTQAKRIETPKPKKKPVVIAKRTLKKKKVKPKESPSKIIDKALAKIEKRAETKKKDPLEEALSGIEKKVRADAQDPIAKAISKLRTSKTGAIGETASAGSGVGTITDRMYQLEIYSRIRENWSYAVALRDSKKTHDLEAVVVLTVRSDGKIMRSRFKRRSSDIVFDRSVAKAIERSDPLPSFPEGYRKTQDEIEITFNLMELEGD